MAGKSDGNPYKKPLSRKAWSEGQAARESNRPRECELSGGRKMAVRAWERGWDELNKSIAARAPKVTHRPVNVTQRSVQRLPEGEPLASVYRKQQVIPCALCRAQRLPTGSKAVVLQTAPSTVAYLRCRSCGETFKLPVEE